MINLVLLRNIDLGFSWFFYCPMLFFFICTVVKLVLDVTSVRSLKEPVKNLDSKERIDVNQSTAYKKIRAVQTHLKNLAFLGFFKKNLKNLKSGNCRF